MHGPLIGMVGSTFNLLAIIIGFVCFAAQSRLTSVVAYHQFTYSCIFLKYVPPNALLPVLLTV